MATATNSDAPKKTGKPGELGRCGPDIPASPGCPITDNFKNDAFRVGKGVRMGAVDDLALRGCSDPVETLTTDNCLFGIRRHLVVRQSDGIGAHLLRIGNGSKVIDRSDGRWPTVMTAVGFYKRMFHNRLSDRKSQLFRLSTLSFSSFPHLKKGRRLDLTITDSPVFGFLPL